MRRKFTFLPMDVLLEIGGSIAYYVACKLPGSNPDAVIASEILRLNQSCCFLLNLNPKIQQMFETR